MNPIKNESENEEQKMKNQYICRRLRMLNYLKQHGFKPTYTMPDALNPKYNVWAFDNSDELQAAVQKFHSEVRKHLAAKSDN